MAVTVSMPQLGETVTEGTILSWAKKPGDTIAEDEVLLEISTDKVDTEVPSPAAGVVQEILVPEGETVMVGTPLAVIVAASEASSEALPEASSEVLPEASSEVSSEVLPEVSSEVLPEASSEAFAPTDEPPAAEVAAAAPSADEPADDQPPAAQFPEQRSVDVELAPANEPAPSGAVAAAAAPAVGVMDGDRRGVLSPVVRRLATEHGIDLTQVPGSGEGGRITRKDVMAHIEAGPKVTFEPSEAVFEPSEAVFEPGESVFEPSETVSAPPAAEPVAPAPVAPEPVAPDPVAPTPVALEPVAPEPAPAAAPASAVAAPRDTTAALGEDDVVELTRLRRVIAENMTNAKRTAAHVWASVEVDYEAVERVRQAHRAAFKEREGFSLTYLPFVARATIDALQEYPVVNSSFRLDEGTQTFHARVNLGIAVDMNQKGLAVVTVREADGLRLAGLARGIREKALKARQGNLEPDDISGSSFTITNPGPFGSFMTVPIINVPNVGILSTDTVTKRAVVVTDEFGHDAIAIRHIGYLGLSWDHRAFDGSTAVMFLDRIRQNLQTWDWEQELS